MMSVHRPSVAIRWLAREGQRPAARGWGLLDAGLAVVLTIGTVEGYQDGGPDGWWWFFAVPMIGAVLIRRRWPRFAFALAGLGATGHHLLPQLVLEPLDLAVPLTLYTLASSARTRRTAAIAVAAAVAGVGLVSLLHVVVSTRNIAHSPSDSGTAAPVVKVPDKFADPGRFADSSGDPDVVTSKPTTVTTEPAASVGDLVGAAVGQGLGVMLILGLAAAIGDGVRSRRQHLRAVEQRAVDLEREQQQRVELARAAERARITRELHDVVAHGLSVIVVQAQGAAAALDRHPDRTAEALQNVITTGRDSLAEMRRLLELVRRDPAADADLAPQLGVDSLPDLVDRVRAAGTPVTFTLDGQPSPLPSTVDLSVYRIVQEALTNTIKHAGAGAAAQLAIRFGPDHLEIDVRDDGIGGPIAPDIEGAGLRGIAERVGMLHGELSAGPGSSGGFRVWARLPLDPTGVPA
jgi:signal transduction histidine kinase